MSCRKISIALFFITIFAFSNIFAASFIVKQIRFEGLQHITLGTALSYLPVKEGDRMDDSESTKIIRALYKTGFFNDVSVSQKNGTLVIHVIERATVGAINISGNKEITTKKLKDALKTAGLVEGQPFDNATLQGIKQALLQQYNNIGYYNANVTTVTKDDKGRVNINIQINEGPIAKIKNIKIIGNTHFSQRQLLKNFSLTTSGIFTFFTKSDQFSQEKLDADLDALHSFYLDNGYLKFHVDNSKVDISNDKKAIYITINVTENNLYTIKGYGVRGNLLGKTQEINKLITLKAGKTFSRKEIIDINNAISKFVGDFGYAYPDIQTNPVIDDVKRQVFISFIVNPGKRVYIRRISFTGNVKTSEEILRREMRLQEGSLFSLSKLDESKRLINNLGYIKDVTSKLEPVPGTPDQADLHYDVKEDSSISATGQVGYSDVDGFLYGASLTDKNFLGNGKSIGVQFNNSAYSKNYSLSYYNPYYTMNHISIGTDLYYQKTNSSQINLSSYNTDSYGAAVTYGLPLTERNRLNLGYGFEHMLLMSNGNTAKQVTDFIRDHGTTFSTIRLLSGWNYSNLDRIIFPTLGPSHAINLEVGTPIGGSSLNYYKIAYNAAYYHPMTQYFTLHLRGDLGYADGFGHTRELPFFKNFYSGGFDSVRGFEGNTLGPVDSNNNPLGGNVLGDASFGIVFPNPVGESLRTTLFADTGNVYQNSFQFNRLRSSVGISLDWRSPLGILNFSLAKPVNSHSHDNTEFFQFNLGTSI